MKSIERNQNAMGLTFEDWRLIDFMVKLGVATTLASIPVGVLAMRRWPENRMVPVFMIGIVAVIIRSLMNGSFLQNPQ